MKTTFFILMLLTLGSLSKAQETYHHQFSTAPETSRFQIVQSELGARLTFNIDKYTGSVFLLVEGSEGFAWQLLEAEEQTSDETKPDQVNYQLFTSGLGVKMTFLINVNTGITWQLAKNSETGHYFWNAIE